MQMTALLTCGVNTLVQDQVIVPTACQGPCLPLADPDATSLQDHLHLRSASIKCSASKSEQISEDRADQCIAMVQRDNTSVYDMV
jgi:hypothetical protein